MNSTQTAAQASNPTGLSETAQLSSRTTREAGKGMLSGERKSQCAACGRFFTSTGAFDRHRAWHPDDSVKPYPTNRRRICLDPEDFGMVQRASGHWGDPPMTDEQKRKAGWA